MVNIHDDPAAIGGAHDLTAEWGDGGRVKVLADGRFWFVTGDDFDRLAPGESVVETSFDYRISEGQGGFDTGLFEVEVWA